VEAMMDMAGLPPLAWGTAIRTWHVTPVTDAVLVVVAALYCYRASRTRWPLARTASFLGALVLLAVTIQSAVDVYGHELFWVHMIEHLLLIMVVPALVILGQPIRLLTETSERAAKAMASRTVSAITFPLLALALYAAVLVGTHLTDFMQQMLTHRWLHEVEILLYLGSGYLFFLPLLAHEPLKRQLSYPLRVFLLFLGMSVDTVVGVLLMMSTREPFPAYAAYHRTWGPDLLTDIHTGGGIMWVVGDGLMFAATVLVVSQWMRDTERQNDTGQWLEAARRSSLANLGVDAETEGNLDNDDAALDAYNRMLAKLNERERP
jgi:cytochrome c oxidase assembly factor CtaG